ncbi:MAG: HesA/MoeB/ThiF family protein, partial [Gammaproteobacteria bacterium]
MLTDEQQARYSRHIFLPEIGVEGQECLQAAKVLIIGMGGLGCAAAYYLAASGIGTLYLSDNELVELSNLQRQIVYRTEDIGTLKTEAAKKHLLALNSNINIVSMAGLPSSF